MTSNQHRCDNTCPCRTPTCEETCREYQFEIRFTQWLAVNYPDMPFKKHAEIIEGASEIFDDLCADLPFQGDLKFNSTDLLLLANDEWKRREERKHNHEHIPWTAGFINGFLTDKKWARGYIDKLRG